MKGLKYKFEIEDIQIFKNAFGVMHKIFSNYVEKWKSYAKQRWYEKKLKMHAVSMTHTAYRPYLGEFEAEYKKAFARESGAQGVSWHCPF
jgi:hypothetical protein